MRDNFIFGLKRALPRMSWTPANLFNLYQRTMGPKKAEITFRSSESTLFAQRWKSKAAVRAYHGDFIPEKIFRRWYLPDTLPDVRPKRPSLQASKDARVLEEYVNRKTKVTDYHKEEKVKGLAPVGSLMFAEVERRLDVFIFRCCFAQSVYEARRLVIHGSVLVNGKKHTNANTRLAPGDMISVDPSAIRFLRQPRPELVTFHDDVNGYEKDPKGLTPFYLPHYASPWLFVPAYIEVNYATCSAIYVRHPTARPGYSEIPTPYDADGEVVRFAWEWYVKRRPRLRSRRQASRRPEDRTFRLKQVVLDIERKRLHKIVAKRKLAAKGIIA